MVSISRETTAQTHKRLRAVIAQADFVVHQGVWVFEESPVDQPPEITTETLAVVRDKESWSRLVPLTHPHDEAEKFGIFSFHFTESSDNSGFVGWLASLLKADLGTGVFVVCGSNSARGGIYDYWGCPIELLDQAVAAVTELRSPGGAAMA